MRARPIYLTMLENIGRALPRGGAPVPIALQTKSGGFFLGGLTCLANTMPMMSPRNRPVASGSRTRTGTWGRFHDQRLVKTLWCIIASFHSYECRSRERGQTTGGSAALLLDLTCLNTRTVQQLTVDCCPICISDTRFIFDDVML